MNQEMFLQSCEKVINQEVTRDQIGTLSEKTLHAVLKHYFDPNLEHHEIKVGRMYADIVNENGIIEIQTRQFNKLRSKLSAFLKNYEVTVVYPIPYEKMLFWVDEETGEISKGRKSPKKGNAYSIFPELYKIKSVLNHKNIRFCIVMVNIEEYRFLNGWSQDRKKGSSCNDRIPTMLKEEIYINSKEDYLRFVPTTLPEEFDSKEFAKAAHIPLKRAQVVLNILTEVEAVRRVGKRGRGILYSRS